MVGRIFERKIYQKMLDWKRNSNGNKLLYYTFSKDNSTHNYKINFLLAKKNKVCPIEVKSSGYKTHASIDAFANKFSSKIGSKYLIYTKDLKKDGDLLCLPVYMTMFL